MRANRVKNPGPLKGLYCCQVIELALELVVAPVFHKIGQIGRGGGGGGGY